MSQLSPSENVLEPLFMACKEASVHLSGTLNVDLRVPDNNTEKHTLLLNGKAQDIDAIDYLYESLKSAFPNAGQAYWITRSWNLLCWQPLYIAIIAVYQCQQVPSFIGFTQQVRPLMVSGFSFSSSQVVTGQYRELIQQVGKQLKPLFEFYQFHLNEQVRCRPSFAKRLLADNLMIKLVGLQKQMPQFSSTEIIEHAHCWFDVLGLDKRLIDSFYMQKNSIEMKRSSCCLAYKTPTGKLCVNCPKNRPDKNKH